MSKEKILAKVQKLLALGESPNPHEAELATQKAAELLARYDMTMMDVIAKKRKDGTVMDMISKALFEQYGDGKYVWEGMVVATLAGVFECSCIRSYKKNSMQREFNVFGMEKDLEMVAHFFRFLRMRITNSAKSKYMGKKETYFYAQGMMTVISNRLNDMYIRKEAILKANVETKDLVIFKKDLAEKAMRQQFPKIQHRKGPQSIDRRAYNIGMGDGARVPLSKPIGHDGEPLRHLN